jgi:predicted dehydrogenase
MPRIRIGLIGCGGIVQRTHLPILRQIANVDIVAVADPDESNLQAVGGQSGVPGNRRYADHRDLLAAGGIDLVSIASPHHLHGPQVLDSAAAGVGVICEKPMAPTLDEGIAVAAAVKKRGIFYTVSHNFLYTPGNVGALAMLSGGRQGRAILGRGQSSFPKDAPLDKNYWRNRNDSGGGTLNDTCYHEIYQVEALVGAPIATVRGNVSTRFHDISTDDCVALFFEHSNGAISTVFSSWFANVEVEPSFCEVHTEKGSIRTLRRGLELHTSSRQQPGWTKVALPDVSAPGASSGHTGFFEAAIAAFGRKEPGPFPLEAGLHQLAIIQAARRASASGRSEEVPPVSI